MPFLALTGTTIPLAHEPADAEVRRFGDEAEASDGTLLTRRRARKREWGALRTKYVPIADAPTLLALLDTAPPHEATGDLVGSSTWVIVTVTREITHTLGSGRFVAYEFIMREE